MKNKKLRAGTQTREDPRKKKTRLKKGGIGKKGEGGRS